MEVAHLQQPDPARQRLPRLLQHSLNAVDEGHRIELCLNDLVGAIAVDRNQVVAYERHFLFRFGCANLFAELLSLRHTPLTFHIDEHKIKGALSEERWTLLESERRYYFIPLETQNLVPQLDDQRPASNMQDALTVLLHGPENISIRLICSKGAKPGFGIVRRRRESGNRRLLDLKQRP